jgi:hypothetical protein
MASSMITLAATAALGLAACGYGGEDPLVRQPD